MCPRVTFTGNLIAPPMKWQRQAFIAKESTGVSMRPQQKNRWSSITVKTDGGLRNGRTGYGLFSYVFDAYHCQFLAGLLCCPAGFRFIGLKPGTANFWPASSAARPAGLLCCPAGFRFIVSKLGTANFWPASSANFLPASSAARPVSAFSHFWLVSSAARPVSVLLV